MKNEEGTSFSHGPKTVLQRPELAVLIGAIAAEWSLVEFHHAELYALLIGSRLPAIPFDDRKSMASISLIPPSAPIFAPLDDLAIQIFERIPPVQQRIKLVEDLADRQLAQHADALAKLKNVIHDKILKTSTRRNDIVHGLWGVASAYPNELLLIEPFKPKMVYGKSDFQEVLDRIGKLATLIGAFNADLVSLLGKS